MERSFRSLVLCFSNPTRHDYKISSYKKQTFAYLSYNIYIENIENQINILYEIVS